MKTKTITVLVFFSEASLTLECVFKRAMNHISGMHENKHKTDVSKIHLNDTRYKFQSAIVSGEHLPEISPFDSPTGKKTEKTLNQNSGRVV